MKEVSAGMSLVLSNRNKLQRINQKNTILCSSRSYEEEKKNNNKSKMRAETAVAFLLLGHSLVRIELIRKRVLLYARCLLLFSLENAFTVCCLSACPASGCFRMLWMRWEQTPPARHCRSPALGTARSAQRQSIFEPFSTPHR